MAVEKRAMNDKDKLKRREKIFQVAWQLFKKNDGKLPTVSVIARKAGVSKGCVYLYFKTKNEIFLHLYVHQLRQWHESVANSLKKSTDPITIKRYAELTTQYLVEHPMLLKMGGIVNAVLEDNMDEQVLLMLKMELTRLLEDRTGLTSRLFPGLTSEEWMNVHLRIYAMIFGLWQMFYSTPNIHKILQKGEISIFEPDFYTSAVASTTTFLKGALNTECPG